MQSIDIAEYILKRSGAMSAMKLQKLVYYCQAWSLAWDGRPLFDEDIEAWANGPVAPALYRAHAGKSLVHSVGGNTDEIDSDAGARETIESVLQFYGDKSSQWLSDLTHAERPWKEARQDLPPGTPSNRTISRDVMAAYYSQL